MGSGQCRRLGDGQPNPGLCGKEGTGGLLFTGSRCGERSSSEAGEMGFSSPSTSLNLGFSNAGFH